MANKFIIIIALTLISYGVYNMLDISSGGCPFHTKNTENLRHSLIN